VSEERFTEQWSDPLVGTELHRCGFEKPEQIGATFLMDVSSLRAWTKDVEPLVDNFPRRIFGKPRDVYEYSANDLESLMDTAECSNRFHRSPLIARLWPASLREKTQHYFELQELIDQASLHPGGSPLEQVQALHRALANSSLRFPVLTILGGPEFPDVDRVLATVDEQTQLSRPDMRENMAIRAVADRDLLKAEGLLADAQRTKANPRLTFYRAYLLCAAGQKDAAMRLIQGQSELFSRGTGSQFLEWLSLTFPDLEFQFSSQENKTP
jgi:hypothetical protein